MYVEADAKGRIVIQDMSTEQAEWVQNALLSAVENHYKGTPVENVLRRAAMEIDRVRRPEPKPSIEQAQRTVIERDYTQNNKQ